LEDEEERRKKRDGEEEEEEESRGSAQKGRKGRKVDKKPGEER
jgi:hypothetical protein